MIITTESGDILLRGPCSELHLDFTEQGKSYAVMRGDETGFITDPETQRIIKKHVPIDVSAAVRGTILIELGPR